MKSSESLKYISLFAAGAALGLSINCFYMLQSVALIFLYGAGMAFFYGWVCGRINTIGLFYKVFALALPETLLLIYSMIVNPQWIFVIRYVCVMAFLGIGLAITKHTAAEA